MEVKQIRSPRKPKALIDTCQQLHQTPECVEDWMDLLAPTIPSIFEEYQVCIKFLHNYAGSPDTFNTYRREVERHLQWTWLVAKKSIYLIESTELHNYMSFVQKPPQSWIGTKNVSRFIEKDTKRIHNPDWRPFVARIAKSKHKEGQTPTRKQYQLNNHSLASILAVLSTFYAFLQQNEVINSNPVQMLRQKSRYIQKRQSQQVTRRLSHMQWLFVIETCSDLAEKEPQYERHLFILSAFYLLGLRISELAETPGRTPQMGDFYPDRNGCWWFTTVGKGNKQRDVAVPDAMLNALRRYRMHLELSSLPIRNESTPLIGKERGLGGLGTRQIRNLVQKCFNHAIQALREAKQLHEAEDLGVATVHWLRHTAISADVQHRPREHVRDDAGHESALITDRYIDIDRLARHGSAKDKALIPKENEDASS